MIKVNGLTKSYGEQTLFDDVSFSLGSRERVGLVGRNGHGKTTLFRIITGEEECDAGEIIRPRHYTTAYLKQHLSFTFDTVLDEAVSALGHHSDGADMSYKVKAILAGLGFSEEQLDMSPLALSGGFQVRLNLAKALASEPNLLLLDEPTNYLDILSMRWLKGFLKRWPGEMMMITHDKDFMDSVSTHTMAIHRRGIKKLPGGADKLYARIAEDEEIHEKTRVNMEKKRAETEQFINRFRAKASKAAAVQSRVKLLEKQERLEGLDRIKELDFSFNEAGFNGKFLMDVKELSFGYDPQTPLIRNLSLSVGPKDRIAVIGRNGKGKSTLMNLFAGELVPLNGGVRRHDALKQAYFGQTNIDRLLPDMTVEETLIEAHPDNSRAVARRICGAMMFEGDMALKKVSVLSGGEKSRVLLGKLLVATANMLLLDEPTNHLDMHSVDALVEAVLAFSGAVIMVTHSEMIVHRLATRLIVFDDGEVTLFEGTYQDFLDRVGWKEEAAVRAETPAPSGNAGKWRGNRESRKLRNELSSERSRVLSPLKKRMEEIEAAIMSGEGAIEKDNEALALASAASDSPRITELARTCHSRKQEIETLFNELQKVSTEHDAKVKEFDERLKKVQG
ncbi:MAG: ABC-F family ATP-binding cassette domain-containing protein [Deltaproteobacteria bacterium]|nr:ABC-F family ATP-binding cassette domain-containing protein [Deltaproteobacteria bacterium]